MIRSYSRHPLYEVLLYSADVVDSFYCSCWCCCRCFCCCFLLLLLIVFFCCCCWCYSSTPITWVWILSRTWYLDIQKSEYRVSRYRSIPRYESSTDIECLDIEANAGMIPYPDVKYLDIGAVRILRHLVSKTCLLMLWCPRYHCFTFCFVFVAAVFYCRCILL